MYPVRGLGVVAEYPVRLGEGQRQSTMILKNSPLCSAVSTRRVTTRSASGVLM